GISLPNPSLVNEENETALCIPKGRKLFVDDAFPSKLCKILRATSFPIDNIAIACPGPLHRAANQISQSRTVRGPGERRTVILEADVGCHDMPLACRHRDHA